MRISTTTTCGSVLLACLALAWRSPLAGSDVNDPKLLLGAFSVSLSVKDIAASRAFYEKLGFAQAGGVQEQNWLVMRSGLTTIGLFQGMFEGNLMTFNPGWGPEAKPLESFEDVRDIQRRLKAAGIELTSEADEASTDTAYFTLSDPDGNQILFDQHVPRPGKASAAGK